MSTNIFNSSKEDANRVKSFLQKRLSFLRANTLTFKFSGAISDEFPNPSRGWFFDTIPDISPIILQFSQTSLGVSANYLDPLPLKVQYKLLSTTDSTPFSRIYGNCYEDSIPLLTFPAINMSVTVDDSDGIKYELFNFLGVSCNRPIVSFSEDDIVSYSIDIFYQDIELNEQLGIW